MNEKVKAIIQDILKEEKYSQDYIKYSAYKYEIFEGCVAESKYNTICEDMNLYFDTKEEKTLFKILQRLGWKAIEITDYNFYSLK